MRMRTVLWCPSFPRHQERDKRTTRLRLRIPSQHIHQRKRLLCKVGGIAGRAAELTSETDPHIFGDPRRAVLEESPLFFANYEAYRQREENSVVRIVPSDAMRDGVILYQCQDPTQCPGGNVMGALAHILFRLAIMVCRLIS